MALLRGDARETTRGARMQASTITCFLHVGRALILTATLAEAYYSRLRTGVQSIASPGLARQSLPPRQQRNDSLQRVSRLGATEDYTATLGARNPKDGRGRNQDGRALSMTKAAKEGDVVLKSVKVGPLKQENVYLPSGVSMEALCQAPSTGAAKRSPLPPLVFIHGSYHAAWCWAEHWMPFLASKGYETYSISLRGTSGTRPPCLEGDGTRIKMKISDHVSDVKDFAETMLPGKRPVFISHSFGGIVLLKLMEGLASDETAGVDEDGERQGSGTLRGIQAKISGGVFLCSVPPSGNGPMTKRFIKERPVAAVKIVLGFVLKMATYWPWLARDLFFTKSLEQSALRRYMENFKADSVNGLDLGDLRGQLPSKFADADGKAKWIAEAPPRLVIGAERDRLVDKAGIEEMATFLDTEYVMLPTVPHEVMLGPDWPLGVARVLQWLEATDFQDTSTT